MRLIINCFYLVSTKFQSTHPNAGCDLTGLIDVFKKDNFNPRIPTRDATKQPRLQNRMQANFNPRIPTRDATAILMPNGKFLKISIHASQRGMRRDV